MIDPRLDLKKVIRPTLIRLEDSLIMALFERTSFKTNDVIYTRGALETPTSESFFDYLFHKTQALHSSVGRFDHPSEIPFFEGLPASIIPRQVEESVLAETDVNYTAKIRETYLQAIKDICEQGDDLHYGSSTVSDITCLHTLSNRIHFGRNVAEAKFQQEPEKYNALIEAGDVEGIDEALTNAAVEREVLARVRRKGEKYSVDPSFVEKFYKDKIIPMTKEVEVDYFLQRGGK